MAGRVKNREDYTPETAAESYNWRRVRDSNPRYPLRYAGFQDRCHQPLGQLSVNVVYRKCQIPRHFTSNMCRNSSCTFGFISLAGQADVCAWREIKFRAASGPQGVP